MHVFVHAQLISRKYLEGDAELAVDLPKEIRPVVVSRAANGPWTQDLFVDAQMYSVCAVCSPACVRGDMQS